MFFALTAHPRNLDANYLANTNVVINRENLAPRIFPEVRYISHDLQSKKTLCKRKNGIVLQWLEESSKALSLREERNGNRQLFGRMGECS